MAGVPEASGILRSFYRKWHDEKQGIKLTATVLAGEVKHGYSLR